MKIKKVEYKKDTMSIELLKVIEGGSKDTIKVKLHEDPAPKFKETLTKLKKFVIQYHELDKHDPKTISCVGIKLSYSGDSGSRSVSLLGNRKLKQTEGFTDEFETPVKLMDIGEGENQEFALDSACVKLVDKLCEETVKYMKGARLQKNIFELND